MHHQSCDVDLLDIPPLPLQPPSLRVLVMPSLRLTRSDSRTPSHQRRSRIVRLSISVIPLAAHPVICGEDERRLVVPEELAERVDGLLDDVIDDADVAVILWSMRSIRMTSRVAAEEVQEEDCSRRAKSRIEGRGVRCVGEEDLELVQDPEVEVDSVGGEVLGLGCIAPRLDRRKIRRSLLEHAQNVGRSERVDVRRLVEN